MNRYKLTVEYIGSKFSGWSKFEYSSKNIDPNILLQRNFPIKPSVEFVLTQAINNLLNKNVQVFGSSRTDSGVNALANVAHVDLDLTTINIRSTSQLVLAINNKIKKFYIENEDKIKQKNQIQPLSVHQAELVSEDFHAKLSAKSRKYIYNVHLVVATKVISPIFINTSMNSWEISHTNILDFDKMKVNF
eukprot:TRINITY_DN2894_c0_g1_i2.p1 TRINITY_DN2894_c0_g1~~TRINITY_DN2894_c0_g1_i2.p1  ORF type:complete len:190 (+),score=50.90 TRINITY_DN2894_c0_g1_i2:47-616(+)